ncbi:hypothetical protein NQ317_018600 [Molorchus minor]|uniref:Aquaporin n=1 Tax=Molorchus minor TaxID=1323400 RepID=A0ABQ9JL74_9CUCU|nr:hypothetical protein NQ317_018600 [Molorchus minor]
MAGCPYIISFMTEFISTNILMYIGCMGCIELYGLGPTLPAFTFGFSILAAVLAFRHISPVHMNPAVSVAHVVMNSMEWKRCLVYVVAQYIGAITGYGLLKATMAEHPNLCVLKLENNTSPWQGFLMEAMIAMILMLVVAGSTDTENYPIADSIATRIGMLIVGLVFSLAPFTGACLNPARSLAPCIYYNNWTNHWLYHLSPYTGCILGAILYRFLIDNHEKYSLYNLIHEK